MTGNTRVTAQAAKGIFLSAAVGDALGWPQEARGGLLGGQKERDRAEPQMTFRGWIRSAGHYSGRYRDPVAPGEYSDDTQLLLASARACLTGDAWWRRLTEAELPTWPQYQRGGGGAVLRACALWAKGRPPWRNEGSARAQAALTQYRNAGANGVAMRIAPHVLWAPTSRDLVQRVLRDGITTHGHPRALVGALIYAFALRHATRPQPTHGFGDSIEAAAEGLIDAEDALAQLPPQWGTASDVDRFAVSWRDTNKEAQQLLEIISDSLQRGAMSNPEATLERLGCTDPKTNGSGTVSATAAIYLASRFAARPQGGLLTAAFLRKADTDTLASMTAAILGALHGTDWLGELAHDVQDAEYIAQLAESSSARTPEPIPGPTRQPQTLREALRENLLTRQPTHRTGDSVTEEFPDGRGFRLTELDALDRHIIRARLRLTDGQTVLIDLPANKPTTAAEPNDADRPEQPGKSTNRPSSPHSGDSRTSTTDSRQSTAPKPAPAGTATFEAGVVLPTHSLTRSAAFYAQLTGCDVPIRAGAAHITPGLLLQPTTGTVSDASAIVQITVDDLVAAVQRLRSDSSGNRIGSTDTFETRDPDGRIVRVSQRPSPPEPARG